MTIKRPTTFYNPHLLSRDELVAGFIARQPLLEILVDDLRRGGGQHHLLIGARGTGKTTLLLRLALAIDEDPKLAKKAIALRFPEEQYNVARPSDFWLNCADALVDALEDRGEAGEAGRLDREIAVIEDLGDEDERAERGLGLLTGWGERARKLVVLLVDNVDIVLDRMPDDHWALRKALGNDDRLVLIGASSAFLPATIEYGSAFYEFFNVHELSALTDDEARGLLLHLAKATGTPAVTRAVTAEPGRVKALLTLSGGSPRTLGLLHGILASDSTASAEQDLEALLDQVTPYYKARFDDLPEQSQRVVDAVALHWHPITAAECASRTRLDISLVSAQLSRLVRQGVIAKVPGDDSKLTFQIAERFFNIWYLMRASRRLRRQLFWLVASLQSLYGQDEVERRAAELLATPEGAEAANDPARLLAFATAVADPAVKRRLEHRAVAMLVRPDALDLDGEDAHLRPVVERAQAARRLARKLTTADIAWPNDEDPSQYRRLLMESPIIGMQAKERVVDRWRSTTPDPLELDYYGSTSWVGSRLAVAAGRGEVPSFEEVARPTDVDDILALVDPDRRTEALVYMLLAMQRSPDASVWRHLLALERDLIGYAVMIAGRAGRAAGTTGRQFLDISLAAVGDEPVPPELTSMTTWSEVVKYELVADAVELLLRHHLDERMPIVLHALRAIEANERGPLLRLAPELRAPAEWFRDQLLAEAGLTSASPARSAASARKPGRPAKGSRRTPGAPRPPRGRPARPGRR